MRILVAVKQVPARDAALVPAAGGRWVETGGLAWEMNEPDAYALEAGLRLREEQGGEVVVLGAGPAAASATIREALAKGADRAIHVEQEGVEELDPLALGALLAAAAREERPDLILTGLQSDDLGFGQTGVVMAELMGLNHATLVTQVECSGGLVRVKRELEDGWHQFVELPLPVLLAVQSGIHKLRYATLMGIKKARTKEIKRVTAAELGVTPAPGVRLCRLSARPRMKQTVLLPGDAGEQARRLAEILKREAQTG